MIYKLHIAYDGTGYHGWQFQDGTPDTVAGILETTFRQTFGVPLSLVGASRTDAGVHAYDQVARCITNLQLDPEHLCKIWNRALPSDIVVRKISHVGAEFHPQRCVASKVYWYHIFRDRPLPFIARYGWSVSRTLNVNLLYECLHEVVGTHNFRSFCTGNDIADTVRTIQHVSVVPLQKYNALRVAIRGPSFLYKMVRRIIGAAVHIATHPQRSRMDFCEVFAACNPLHTLPTAPAQGLLLRKITYRSPEYF